MALRIAAGIRLGIKKKFTINALRKYFARHKVRDVSHLFEELAAEIKKFKQAHEQAEIDDVINCVMKRVSIGTEIEEDFRYINETKDIFVREVLEFLREVHNGFKRVLGRLDRSHPLHSKIQPLIEKYNQMINHVIPTLSNEDEMLRKVTAGRYMLTDAATLKAFILKYLHLKMLISGMRKADSKAKTEEKKVLRDLDAMFDLLKSKDAKDTDKIISHLGKHLGIFDKAIEKCVENAYTVTRLTVILKHQLQKAIEELRSDVGLLAPEGFPKEELDTFGKKIAELEVLDRKYAEMDYAEARALTKLGKDSGVLKAT